MLSGERLLTVVAGDKSSAKNWSYAGLSYADVLEVTE